MRKLKEKEEKLIKFLLKEINYDFEVDSLNAIDMTNGMGSITLLNKSSKKDRVMSKVISEMTFIDEDNIPISVSLNIDTHGNLYELDIWKVDFTRFIRYPSEDSAMSKEGKVID